MTANETINRSDLRKQAQQLVESGRMPSLDAVLQALSETRRKYRPLILAARQTQTRRNQ